MSLGTWITAHKGDATRATFWLVKLGLPTPVYLTDCDQPIVYDGNSFTPDPLTVDGFQSDTANLLGSGGRLTLATGGSYWVDLIGAIATGNRTFEVTFWEAWLDVTVFPSPVPAAVRPVAATCVESAEWDQQQISFTLGPLSNPALHRLPAREYSATCLYAKTGGFKGPLCGYSGSATTCDGASATCVSLSNQTRFGGFGSFLTESQDVTFEWTNEGVPYTGILTVTRRER